MTPGQTRQALAMAAGGKSVRGIASDLGVSRTAVATALRHGQASPPLVEPAPAPRLHVEPLPPPELAYLDEPAPLPVIDLPPLPRRHCAQRPTAGDGRHASPPIEDEDTAQSAILAQREARYPSTLRAALRSIRDTRTI